VILSLRITDLAFSIFIITLCIIVLEIIRKPFTKLRLKEEEEEGYLSGVVTGLGVAWGRGFRSQMVWQVRGERMQPCLVLFFVILDLIECRLNLKECFLSAFLTETVFSRLVWFV